MDELVSTAQLQRLLGVGKPALTELAARGIVKRGPNRGTYKLEESVLGYCHHLREQAAGGGGEAGAAQADLTETNAKVETLWRTKLKAFRNRVLAIPHRVEYLSARQTLTLTQELRACLDELADES